MLRVVKVEFKINCKKMKKNVFNHVQLRFIYVIDCNVRMTSPAKLGCEQFYVFIITCNAYSKSGGYYNVIAVKYRV